MVNFYSFRTLKGFFLILFSGLMFANLQAQSFSLNELNFNGKGNISNGTSLSFGPDGRLYVAEYTGQIKILTIDRVGPGDYLVLDMEVISGIQNIQDHNDDGSLYSSIFRQVTGITVAGTSVNPVLYVGSSDFRIGGAGSGDVNLDTNSGIITRYSWNGNSWDEVDLVRGLPRSEENHALNGLEFTQINGIDYLIVAVGGHTNGGAPSKNFAYTTEYSLSAAIISVNLTMLNSMAVKNYNGRNYIYDLPTLDDPTRPNINGITDPDDPAYDGIDENDPFGGNDGLNQAMIVPGGPVQIFSPGYRNAYDLVITESGAVYVTDNGANGGWGGFPVNEGTQWVNNDYDPEEPGSSSPSDGEQINNKDHLTLVTTDISNYEFGSFYGGHPAPVRANPEGAGLYTNPAQTGTEGAVFRTLIYHPTKSTAGYTTDPGLGLPSNWPPVSVANPVEGDWRGPGIDNPDGPEDELVTIWGTNTNAIDEYTASNFNNGMKGDLIAGVNTGVLRRVELKPDGSLEKLTSTFVSGLNGNALGVTCNSDTDIFPGTIWVVTLDGQLSVLEPQDFNCIQPDEAGYDPLADYDSDGYTNQDEVDNGTDPCNGGSQPNDHNKAAGAPLISDLNDLDDDSDGIPDSEDPFQLGDPLKDGSDAFEIPVINELFSSNVKLKGYLGLGLTGLMNNGDPNPNWLNWLDRRDDPNDPNPNDILGGAIGAMTMQMTSGTALGLTNNQEKGFQYGVQVNHLTGAFTVAGSLINFNDPLQLYGNSEAPNAELGFFIGDGFQSNYIKFVITPNGLLALQELNDVPQTPINLDIPVGGRPEFEATFFLGVKPSSGEILLEYSFDGGTRMNLGTIHAQGAILQALQETNSDLAVGFIGTSNAEGVEVEGTWDYLNVIGSEPFIVKDLMDIEEKVGVSSEEIDLRGYFDDDKGVENLVFSVEANTNPEIGAVISGQFLTLTYPSFASETTITIRATDADANFVEQRFIVSLKELGVLYRVNSGGPAIAAIDGELDWGGDTTGANSPYLSVAGNNKTGSFGMTGYTSEVDQNTTPVSIFDTERYDDKSGAPNMTYTFPVSNPGNYEVRLYMGNGYSGTSDPGTRIFDVAIEGVLYSGLSNIDLSGTFGHQIGAVVSQTVEVIDGAIDIVFLHGSIENPLVNGIEILGSDAASNPIEVTEMADQLNVAGDELDGSLVVYASGGDGNLVYSMTGAPSGIVIEPTNGQIGGTVALDAAENSPYLVTVFVDDSDEDNTDVVSTGFTWAVTNGEPVIVADLADLNREVGAPSESIDLSSFFDDNNGVGNLVYTVTGNTDPSIGAVISGNILSLSYPDSPAVSEITIRATDADANFVEQSFMVSISESGFVLYRVNSGGPAIVAIDGELDWGGDSSGANSPYLSVSGTNKTGSFEMIDYTSEVDLNTTPVSIFDTERYDDQSGAPNMTYTFPVSEPGTYEVRLYMGNGFSGTSDPGTRIFDVAIEGVIYSALNNIDLSGTFGHQIGAVVSQTVEVFDGAIDIVFLHGSIENPLVNGIEILGAAGMDTSIKVLSIANQTNYESDILDGSLSASASGGDGALVYSMTGAPAGASIDPATGVISGTIEAGASLNSPYAVTVTVDDSDEDTTDAVSTNFNWIIYDSDQTLWISKNEDENYTARHECSFVQAGNKFYLMGGREEAQKVDIYDYTTNSWTSLVNSAPVEFNHYQATEYQGLIWVIGAFKDNNFPSETSAEFIWIFDPVAVEWIQGPEIPLERRRGSTGLSLYNDKFYITGGNTIGHNGGYVSWFDEFDPATGIWKTLPDAPRARDHFHTSVIGDKLYAAGGRLSGGSGGTFKPLIPEVDVYDFTSGSWSTLPATLNLPTPRAAASVVNYKDKLLVIGGEVEDELVYGEIIKDALKITEEYDPTTQAWSRLSDLNFKRHGTQAIVSGEGVFTLAGSPKLGGGSQKNMEYFGIDAPSGEPGVQSIVSVPGTVGVKSELPTDIVLEISNGNTGVIITSMLIEGLQAGEFSIVSGDLTNALLKPNSSHIISVDYTGLGTEAATLLINYGVAGQAAVILEPTTETSTIQVAAVEDQTNFENDILDGSLVVSASGGDGALVYSLTGAPAGVSIDSSTGVISGNIDAGASLNSPYAVTVTVDDSDEDTTDAASTGFTWTVHSGDPIITANLPDLDRFTGDPDDIIDLNNYFDDNDGVENLVYTVTGNTDPSIEAVISGNFLTLSYPVSPAVSYITIRATDAYANFVEQGFMVTVQDEPVAGSLVLYRVNSGGPAIAAIDGELDWGGDTSGANSPYLSVAGSNKTGSFGMTGYTFEVDQNTTPVSIFDTERYDDKSGAPNMTYTFPVSESGNYEVRLYMGNGWSGTSEPGTRIFDVSIEGVIYSGLNSIDLSGTFGHQMGAVVSQTVEVVDGAIDIVFLHGSIENPLVNGIEILGSAGMDTSIEVASIANQTNYESDILDGSLVVSASGGDGALVYSMTGAPAGVSIDPATGMISGTIDAGASLNSPYTVTVTVDDSDEDTTDAVTTIFNWTVTPGNPVVTAELLDLERVVSSADDIFDLNLYFDDNDGVENLVYTVELNSDPSVRAAIVENVLTLSYPATPVLSEITIRATDTYDNFVEQTFQVNVIYDPEGTLIEVAPVADQNNNIGDVLDESLVVSATGGDGALNYAMTGAPAGVIIDAVTGVISGTISLDAASETPYVVTVTVDDSDEVTVDAVTTNFNWNVTPGNPVVTAELPDLERVVSSADDIIDLNLHFDDNDGVEYLTYSVAQNTDMTIGASITGNLLTLSYPADAAIAEVTIRATDAHNNFVEQTFRVTVIYDPEGTPIDVITLTAQENTIGDILDGSLVVTATGGDGALNYAMTGAPAGVIIDAVTGVITGTIGLDADSFSPYNVIITVDDSDEVTADAVTTNFTWTILPGTPVITTELPDLERIISSVDEEIDLNLYFDDNDGVENLVYTVELNSDPSVGAAIVENVLTLSYPATPVLSEITIRATDTYDNFVEQTFQVNVIYDPEGTLIEVSPVADQNNNIGDILDGSLAVTATGGDGALNYAISGAPAGVVIDAVTGVISGTIDLNAASETPYVVTVTVDDSDEVTTDAVTTTFNWTVLPGTPYVTSELPDLERIVFSVEDIIDLNLHFDDNDGVENLVYTVELNSDPSVGALIAENILTLNYPSVPVVSNITVRATDINSNFVEQTFVVIVKEIPFVLYRVNAGGVLVSSIDDEKDWDADTALENSSYLLEPGTNTVAGYSMNNYSEEVDLTTTPTNIFSSERSDTSPGAPNLTYSFPVPQPGSYEIRLYFGNGHPGTSRPGRQIFDVSIEEVIYPELDNIDIVASFGNQTGAVISKTVDITDGAIDISFIHGTKKNPIINAIEIVNRLETIIDIPIEVAQIINQSNYSGDILDGNLEVSATGGDGALVYSMTGAPTGVIIDPATGVISGTIDGGTYLSSPYAVTVTVDDSDEDTTDAVSTGFTWTVLSGDPIITANLPNLERFTGDPDDNINLNNYFDDNDGVENLVYTVTGNTDLAVSAFISANILTLSYPISPAVSDITIRATDAHANFVEQSFIVTVLEDTSQNPIEIAAIADQTNYESDILDGSLVVSASGGDGALVYSITGAPAGVIIDPATGVISGTIDAGASLNSPYAVTVSVDDSDEDTTDAVSTGFTWTVLSEEPVITTVLPDLERFTGDPDDNINLNNYFDDNDGVENLVYTVTGNTDPTINAVISANILSLSYPMSPAVSDITIRATDAHANFVEQSFIVTVSEETSQTPIEIAAIADQTNYESDILDGSLVVSATGGDGALVYSMTGAPAGVIIDPVTGVISGTIDAGVSLNSPYAVTVNVDDSDEDSTDAVSTGFTWTVLSGDPIITANLPNLERFTGDPDDNINLNNYFDDNDGVESLVYTVTGNTDLSIGAVVSGNLLTLSYPISPAVSDITVRATDADANFVEQSFMVTVQEDPVSSSLVLYRVNAGGPAIPSIDEEMDWGVDTSTELSPYLSEPGTNTVTGYTMTGYDSSVDLSTTPTSIFESERSDNTAGAPNMTYSFPVPEAGNYEVRLYFGNGHPGNSRPDRQIFDVEIEGIIYPELDNFDVTATFGHQVGGVVSISLEVLDGAIDISFLHGAKKKPIINGIEVLKGFSEDMLTQRQTVLKTSSSDYPIEIKAATDQDFTAFIVPNPVVLEAYLHLSNPEIEVKEMAIYAYSGRLVKIYKQPELLYVKKGLYRFNVFGLPDGVYIVNLHTNFAKPINLRLVVKNQ